MPLCGALLSFTKLSTSFIVNLGLSFSDLVHSIGNTLLAAIAAILDVCAVSLAFTQRWRRREKRELSKVIYKAGCWDCKEFYTGKTKQGLPDRKTEHFKALAKSDHSSAIADYVKTTGHNIKWDHFEAL